MISFIDYKKFGFTEDRYESIRTDTRNIPDIPENPSEHIRSHFKKLSGGTLDKDNSLRGQYFKASIIDALIKAGISEDRMNCDVEIIPENKAEVDLFIKGIKYNYCIHHKTSCRERWKQADRDAMVIRYRKDKIPNPWNVFLFYKEKYKTKKNKKDDTDEKSRENAKEKQSQCTGTDEVFSTCTSEFNDFVKRMVEDWK